MSDQSSISTTSATSVHSSTHDQQQISASSTSNVATTSATSTNATPPDQSQSAQPTQPITSPSASQSSALSVLEAAIAQASQQSDTARLAAEKTLRQAVEETGELAQVLPSAIMSATDSLNPVTPTTTAKEAEGLKSPDKSNQLEAGTGIQAVEIEKNPELPPEVEGFINKVEQQADQLPKEIVIADAIKNLPQHHPLPKQPVVVLPITPEIEKVGATKSPKFSVRWLVEWSRRVMKMFVGKVIYRQN